MKKEGIQTRKRKPKMNTLKSNQLYVPNLSRGSGKPMNKLVTRMDGSKQASFFIDNRYQYDIIYRTVYNKSCCNYKPDRWLNSFRREPWA